jgi:DNA-binding transcriptional ArsR family regulator
MRPAHRTLTTKVELDAYLHRTRLAMLALMREQPRTVSQVAAGMGVHPANLARHMRRLEKAGLVSLVEKRDTGRNLEKYYATTAAAFDVALDASRRAPHQTALQLARGELSAALARLPKRNPGPVRVHVLAARLAPERVTAFAGELAKLAERFASCDDAKAAPQHLVMALYPGDAALVGADTVRLATAARRS